MVVSSGRRRVALNARDVLSMIVYLPASCVGISPKVGVNGFSRVVMVGL
jgi:hypothetical protein